jgi:fructose-1,6-bisphosphatase/inositol monophosphatase family enzyme
MAYDKELIFAKELALEAGKIMRRYFRAADIGTQIKDDNTPLTIADTMINDLVIDRVKQEFPEDGVIGEEASYEVKRNRVWVVDPIDGTSPFSLGIPISTFSLGLVSKDDGQTLVAVTYEPQLDDLYTAVRAEGAYLNGTRITVASDTDLSHGYISIIGSSRKQEKTRFQDGVCIDLAHAQGAKCFHFISQVYSASKVASGELLGAIFGYGSAWDSAAVNLLVTEAGGIATDLEGEPRRYDEFSNGSILAANPQIHEKLLEFVRATTE